MSGPLGELEVYDETDAVIYTQDFINLEFPDGWPWDVFQRVVAPVTGMGVNGTRMRLVRNDAPPFRISGVSDYIDFGTAVSAGISVMGAKGYRATLTFTAAGVDYTFSDKFYIWEVFAKPRAAQLASTVAAATSTAILETHLRAQFCKVS